MRGRGGKDIIRVRRVMEKELLTEKTGIFYLRAKGESEQTRAAGGAKEAMPGTERREGKEQGRVSFRASPVYSPSCFVTAPDWPVFTPGPKARSPAGSPALDPPWPHGYCSRACYESAKWGLEQGLKNTALEKLLKRDLPCS